MHIRDLPAALADDRDAAFPHLVRSLQHDVYTGVLRMLGSVADAEELTQDAFVRAYHALGGYPPDRIRALQVRPWLWTIAANLARNRARSRRRKPEAWLDAAPVPVSPQPGPEQQALESQGLAALAEALATLPWAMRSAIVLRHVLDMGYEEIAHALRRPIGTVKSDVHRGLERLRNTLSRGERR
jgi:RNA polymerase sigma-70 factor (ECF subfamily)